MKILVCVKRVVDANVRVRVKVDHSDVDIEHSKMSLNPFDENAIEAAVRLKEAGQASEIIVVSIGSAKCEDTLRTALARGCDRGILVETDISYEPINIAQILASIVESEKPDLVLLGKQAIDDDANQVAQMLAGKLDLPQITFASKLQLNGNQLEVSREIDGGVQNVLVTLPAIVSTDLSLNEPRFIKLPQLMQAKKKPIHKFNLNDLQLNLRPRTRVLKVTDGEVKKQCQMLNSGSELIKILRDVREA